MMGFAALYHPTTTATSYELCLVVDPIGHLSPPNLELTLLSTIATLLQGENTSCVMGYWRLLSHILRVLAPLLYN
jgi:hypothetical protein